MRRKSYMLKNLVLFLILSFIVVTAKQRAAAQAWVNQGWAKLNISAGAGFSEPVQSAGNSLNTGWNLDFRGGYNAGRHLDADLDFSYSHFGLNSAALKRFGEPDGSISVWSLTFQPTLHLLPRRSPANAYLTGGFGFFDRNLTLTQPTVLTTIVCDPFFGCFPVSYSANQIVASVSTVKPGFDTGAGLEFRLPNTRASLFAEARYQRMFSSPGNDMTYVPVTFGIRW